MEKRIFRCLLLLALALTSATGYALEYNSGGLKYTINMAKGGVEVSGQSSTSQDENVTVPATVTLGSATYNVLGIGDGAFKENTVIKSITLSEGLKYIGVGAFEGSIIESISLPNSLKEIKWDAFRCCLNLEATQEDPFVIPDNVEIVDGRAFSGCEKVRSVVFGKNVRYIGTGLFGSVEYWLPEAAHTFVHWCPISTLTFCGMFPPTLGTPDYFDWGYPKCDDMKSQIQKIYVPQIAYETYKENGLWLNPSRIIADPNLPVIGEGHAALRDNKIDYNLDLAAKTAEVVRASIGIGSYDIPEKLIYKGESYTVTSIGEGAFYKFVDLTTVKVPASVTKVGYKAFFGCTSLSSIEFACSSFTVAESAFEGCKSLVSANTDNCTSLGKRSFYGCGLLSEMNLGKCNEIGAEAFSECFGLSSLTFSPGLTTINELTFYNTLSLSDLTVPQGVTSIGKEAFAKSCIKNISFPSTLTTLGEGAFSSCRFLTSITLPKSVTELPKNLFAQSALAEITIPEGVTTIGEGAFSSTKISGMIVLPASVKTIGKLAFSSCREITSVVFKGNVSTIGEDAFSGCRELNAVYTDDIQGWATTKFANEYANPITIAKRIFVRNELLRQLNIGSPNKEVSAYAFNNCECLWTVRVTAKSIGDNAFQGSYAIKDIMLDVDDLGNNVFSSHPTNVYVTRQTPPTAKSESFKPVEYASGYLYVPAGTREVYKAATPCWSRFLDIIEKDLTSPDEIFGDSSGLDEVEVVEEGGVAEWFDLRGVQVDPSNLAPGLYLKRLGSKVTKVIVK